MKKIITLTLIVGCLILTNVQAQDYYQGTVKVELTTSGPQLVFYIKLTGSNRTEGFTSLEFFVTYPNTRTMTFGTIVNNTTNFGGLAMVYGGQNSQGGGTTGTTNEWWYYSNPTGTTSATYTAGTEYELFRVPVSTSSVDFGDLQLEYDGTNYYTYLAISNAIGQGLTTADQGLNVPVYYGPGTYSGANGTGLLSGGYCSYTIFDKPLVPMVLWDDAAWAGGTGTGNQPGSGDGSKKLYVRDANGQLTQSGGAVSTFTVTAGSDLSIMPGGSLTASGATTLTGAGALKVIANASGVGSFIDNGTVTYPSSGTATVQTYIINDSVATTFHPHLIGPTITDPAFETATSNEGVYLSSFNLAAYSSYAYKYVEASNTWLNVFANSTPVLSASGLLFSTTDATDHTLSMTGELISGAFTTDYSIAHGSNNLELISNPYASALDFNAFHAANNTKINNKYYLFNAQIGNYVFYQIGGGGTLTKDIQIGQGFFVETLLSGTLSFANNQRLHSTVPFLKDAYANQLRLNLAGNGFEDATFIYFKDAGVPGYDPEHDVYKWWSMHTNASELWTVASDQSLLSMNSLPSLGTGMVSVPMNFKCGANDTYTITAENVESFEYGTEIYLEDLSTGAEWHNLVDNPVYTFNGNPLGMQNRFIVHFFGPTGIGDPEARSAVQIYGYHRDAYIVNHGSQTIKEYYVYDMMGRELQSGSLPNSTVNKVTIGDVSAYYIVKVITKEGGVYTDKVFITE